MRAKNSYTTADYIEWNTTINLVHRLYKDKDYKMSLLIECGIFLRISRPIHFAKHLEGMYMKEQIPTVK